MFPRIGPRRAMAVLAVAAAAVLAHAAPANPEELPASRPKTGHHHVPGRAPLRWCLAGDLASFAACISMCDAGEIDVVVIEGTRYGLPAYKPELCADLARKEKI